MRSENSRESIPEHRPLESASVGELLRQFLQQTTELLKKELELAKAEVGSSVRKTVSMTVGFLSAGVFGLLALGLFSTAAVLGLAEQMPAWQAALIVGAVMLLIAVVAGLVAKSKRVTKPLERTQKTLKEDVQWAKERMA